MEYGSCATVSTNKLVTAEENKRKLILRNPNEKTVAKVKVDGCLLLTGKRCDYLFEIDQPISKVIYLELKGRNIEDAYEQLVSTVEQFRGEHALASKKTCCVVAATVPKTTAASQQQDIKLKKRLLGIEIKRFSGQGSLEV
jgi:DNA-binding Lrp family transcriptional regulator